MAAKPGRLKHKGFHLGALRMQMWQCCIVAPLCAEQKVFRTLFMFVVNSNSISVTLTSPVGHLQVANGLWNLLHKHGIRFCSISVDELFFLPLTVIFTGLYLDFYLGRRTWALSEQCFSKNESVQQLHISFLWWGKTNLDSVRFPGPPHIASL